MAHEIEQKLKITFNNPVILETVFIHRSFVNEARQEKVYNNERLEFLGDAVLELITTRYLFDTYPEMEEGELTSIRSALVRKENLALIAKSLQLGKYLRLSFGEEKSGGREKDYILANTCEALIGGIYLDQGLEQTEKFITKYILPTLKQILKKKLHIDAKSAFQEYTQEVLKTTPYYKVLEDSGPDHDKIFIMGVYLGDKLVAKGKGSSKRKAEEEAAEKGLKKIRQGKKS